MNNKYFKQYQLNKLQHIKKTYKYIYIFRYYDLKINENILIKKNLKSLNFKSFILKQNLLKNFFIKLKGQGSVLIIYSNTDEFDLLKKKTIFNKMELIYVNINNSIFSNKKIQTYTQNKTPLNIALINSFLFFLYYLRKI